MVVNGMDPMDAAESGWMKRKRSSGISTSDGSQQRLLENELKGKRQGARFRCWTVGIVAIFVLLIVLAFLALAVNLEEAIESSKKILKIQKHDCSACENLQIRGGDKYVLLEKANDERGCAKLTVQCGLDKGTEAIIQWYAYDTDMGVSFMNQEGQSNVRRTVECNSEGQYELDENGHKAVVTAIDCIVAFPHEEL